MKDLFDEILSVHYLSLWKTGVQISPGRGPTSRISIRRATNFPCQPKILDHISFYYFRQGITLNILVFPIEIRLSQAKQKNEPCEKHK